MRDGEGGDDGRERPEAPERDDEAEHEEKVIAALQDVEEARVHEAQRRLVPARIEAHEAGVAVQVERPRLAARRQEAQHDVDLDAEPLEPRPDREGGALGAHRVREQHVQQPLVPVELGVVAEARLLEMRERAFVRGEGAVRLERDAGIDQLRLAEPRVVLVKLDLAGEPQGDRVAQRAVDAREVEETSLALRHVDVAHRLERHAHQQFQRLAFGLDEGLDADFVGDVVRPRARREREKCRGEDEIAIQSHPVLQSLHILGPVASRRRHG